MWRARVSLLATVVLVAVLPGCAYLNRASQTAAGTQANAASILPSLSSDGRWVAFESQASNLMTGDTPFSLDLFVRDNQTKQVVPISVATDGTVANARSDWPSISDDGSRVVFTSEATNLDPGDTDPERDVYIRDRDTDHDGIFDEPGAVSTTLLSGDVPAGTWSDRPEIYGNGNGAVYEVNGPGTIDVYNTVLFGGTFPITRVVSAPLDGSGPANGPSYEASVNDDGGVIAFTTRATNLFAGDTNGVSDVVAWDARGVPNGFPVFLLPVTGEIHTDAASSQPSVNKDGWIVAFTSAATNLVPGESGSWQDVFVADRQTGTITAESRRSDGASANGGDSRDPSISADGTRVSFTSTATDLGADNTWWEDVFVRDRAAGMTQLASTTFLLAPADLYSDSSSLSANGQYVSFASTAMNLVTPDTNGYSQDIFTRAAIVPRIDSVNRIGTVQFNGAFTAAPRVKWGANTLRVTGKGFGPNVSVSLGAGVTVGTVQVTPTELVVDVDVANGSTGTRDLVVNNNGAFEPSGHASSQVCFGCVSIQRWVTVPDPVSQLADPTFVIVQSNNEFTNQTSAPPYFAGTLNPSEFVFFDPNFGPSGAMDITLQQTTNGTVTCAGCLHVVD